METNPREPDRRKLRWLIIGFVCYFLFMVYALPPAPVLPYQIFALCGVLNFAIMGAFCIQHQEGLSENEGTNTPRRGRG
jgi:hypothetical protein